VHAAADLPAAWAELGQVPCVLEKRMELDFEVSALVVRGYDDAVVAYPVSQNIHRDGILHTSTVPAPSLKPAQEKKIIEAAKALIRKIDYVGVLCVEYSKMAILLPMKSRRVHTTLGTTPWMLVSAVSLSSKSGQWLDCL
jgi:phosphoribosylaminoimidazole carboxylase (NCAIR synthetase)